MLLNLSLTHSIFQCEVLSMGWNWVQIDQEICRISWISRSVPIKRSKGSKGTYYPDSSSSLTFSVDSTMVSVRGVIIIGGFRQLILGQRVQHASPLTPFLATHHLLLHPPPSSSLTDISNWHTLLIGLRSTMQAGNWNISFVPGRGFQSACSCYHT